MYVWAIVRLSQVHDRDPEGIYKNIRNTHGFWSMYTCVVQMLMDKIIDNTASWTSNQVQQIPFIIQPRHASWEREALHITVFINIHKVDPRRYTKQHYNFINFISLRMPLAYSWKTRHVTSELQIYTAFPIRVSRSHRRTAPGTVRSTGTQRAPAVGPNRMIPSWNLPSSRSGTVRSPFKSTGQHRPCPAKCFVYIYIIYIYLLRIVMNSV